MIKPEQIPISDEAVEAMLKNMGSFFSREEARSALAAALAAWTGAFQTTTQINRDATEVLILPLTQDKP